MPQLATQPTPSPTPASSEVTVKVLGPAGYVADAQVCASRTGGGERCTTSGADGAARLELVAGTYTMRARPPAGTRLFDGLTPTLDLSGGSNVVVVLEGRGKISGTVLDEAHQGVEGARVCAHGVSAVEVRCERSGSGGKYEIEVTAGSHKLEVAGPPASRLLGQWGFGRIGSYEADAIDTRVADVSGADFVLVRGVVLSGVVSAARGGRPLEEAQVCTYTLAAPLGWECENTDRNGRYALLREPGSYWVWTIPPDDRSRLMYQRYDRVLEGLDASPFELRADRELDVALTEGSQLSGRVTASDGKPVVLALVCLDTPFPTGRICRRTSGDGSYSIGTRPEAYVVNVAPLDGSDVVAGFWPDAAPDWTKARAFRIGAADARLDMVLPRGVLLTGTVRDARGIPLEGVTINVNDGAVPRFFGSTDVHGRYSIAVLPDRTYTIDVFSARAVIALSVVGQSLTVTRGDVGYDVVLPDVTLP